MLDWLLTSVIGISGAVLVFLAGDTTALLAGEPNPGFWSSVVIYGGAVIVTLISQARRPKGAGK